jgi:glycosyltransferase involved in cell wall biosynthesis
VTAETAGLVSVMMPAYNAEPYLEAAIQSVRAQRYAQWELVVVDDGSTDGTATVAARQAEADPRIQLVTQANAGEAAARNTALAHVRGEFVAFLDADDLFLPDHLERTAAYLQAHPERDAVYTDGCYINPAGERLEPLSRRRRGPFEGRIFEQLVRASDVFGPPICVVLRRLPVVGRRLAFDPAIVIGPDWDFLTRFAEASEFGYLDQVTCLYRVHTANITRTAGSERRRQSLARCREKAIQLPAFDGCRRETQWYAFYDLLVNLLTGLPERQADVTGWPQFQALPAEDRAQLLRLMASQALAAGARHPQVGQWLREAQALNPSDRRSRLLSGLYRLSPGLCRLAVRLRAAFQPRPAAASPFGRLE